MHEQDSKSSSIRTLAQAFLLPAINIFRQAADRNRATDPGTAKIFSDRADELQKKAQEAGVVFDNPQTPKTP